MLRYAAEQVYDIVSKAPLYAICLQLILVIWVLWYLLQKGYKNGKKLSPEERARIINEWVPEPLVGYTDPKHRALSPKIVTESVGHQITIEHKKCLNMASHNYLGLLNNIEIQTKAIESIHKYGVGSCGPRGFYGTVDIHLELEERLAKFMNMEEAVVYSYGFSTIASAIPAYAKRGDLVFVDEKMAFAAQKGLDASRSKVHYFKHNDMVDLERLLMQQSIIDKKNPRKAASTRRFLIVEGIYMNTGTICPLPELIDLRKKYKLRLFVDETVSFGTLGKNGRGVTEHFNVDCNDVDMIVGSLDLAMGSIGGFCVGSSFIVEHQRLSGLGYCFSASLPPLLAQVSITALEFFEKDPAMFKRLQDCCCKCDEELKRLSLFEISGDPLSPVKHLYLKVDTELGQFSYLEVVRILDKIVDACIEENLAIVQSAYLEEVEKYPPRPSIRLTVNNTLSSDDIKFAVNTIQSTSLEIFKNITQ